MYKVGCVKVDITNYVYDKGMMGYSVHFHVVKGVATPLHVRAFVIKDEASGKKVVMVNSEICFYTIAMKNAVVKRLQTEHAALGFNNSNVMLTAQHTHSAPGGYSHYMLYNLAIPGFQPKVFNSVVEGTVDAIVQADAKAIPAKMYFDTGKFQPKAKVAFNRSLLAYNANPEAKKKVLKKYHHLAIDRTMKLLRFESVDGQPIGSINWFGVHPTSVGNKHNKICADNKGYAAEYLENDVQKKYDNPEFIGAFAQDTAGDVSPNHQYETPIPEHKEYKSAQQNGRIQFQKAKKIFDNAPQNTPLKGKLDYISTFIDFANVVVDPIFVKGVKGLRTAPSAIGIHMLLGANDRPALPALPNFMLNKAGSFTSNLLKLYEKGLSPFANRKKKHDIKTKHAMHGNKNIIIEPDKGKILGTFFIQNMVLPSVDPIVARLKQIDRDGYSQRTPWMPRVIPLQLFTIGELAIVGISAEITTVAGERLRNTVLKVLKHKGIKEVILATYANGYHGYITTHQEYGVQLYEGAHTIFGKWTLPAYQTKVRDLAIEMLKDKHPEQVNPEVVPDIFNDDEIWYG